GGFAVKAATPPWQIDFSPAIATTNRQWGLAGLLRLASPTAAKQVQLWILGQCYMFHSYQTVGGYQVACGVNGHSGATQTMSSLTPPIDFFALQVANDGSGKLWARTSTVTWGPMGDYAPAATWALRLYADQTDARIDEVHVWDRLPTDAE